MFLPVYKPVNIPYKVKDKLYKVQYKVGCKIFLINREHYKINTRFLLRQIIWLLTMIIMV